MPSSQPQAKYNGRMVQLPNVNEIRPGDIVLTFNAASEDRKGSKQSQLIAAATNGRFSHALICSSPPTLIKAIGSGVSTISLARCFAHDIKNVKVLRYADSEIANRAAGLAQLEIGRDYSVTRAVRSIFSSSALAKVEDRGTFCSALVAQAYMSAGAPEFARTPVENTTPATLDSMENLEDVTAYLFRLKLAPVNIESMSALDGDRTITLAARQTALSGKYAKVLFPKADNLARRFPELNIIVTPTFYGILDFVIKSQDRAERIAPQNRSEFESKLREIDLSLAAFIDEGELKSLLDEIAKQDDSTLAKSLAESFKAKPDIDIEAMKNYLVATKQQLASREGAIKSLERCLEHSAAVQAYLPIDRMAADATRVRLITLQEILARLAR